ncbi:MAG: hypothetical protein DRN13_00045 [Thermoplasmata archaeon]|nr:MAG: hypothetical protein DRN13_00045 [Thermoplasmata archaeon]
MKRAVSAIIAVILLLAIWPPSALPKPATHGKHIFFFREDTIPYLSKYPPEKEEISLTLNKTFILRNLTGIEGDMCFDLYFMTPLFNLSGILKLLVDVLDVYSNLSIEYPKNISIGDILFRLEDVLRNLTLPKLNLTNVSMPKLIPVIGYKISVEINGVEKSKSIEVCRLESLGESNRSLRDILNELKDILLSLPSKERNIVHKRVYIEDMDVSLDEETEMFVSIYCTDEFLQLLGMAAEIIGIMNDTALQRYVEEFLEENNMSEYKGLANLFVKLTKRLIDIFSSSVGFVYDCIDCPSSLSFKGSIVGSERFGAERYYLRKVGDDLILSGEEPEGNDTSSMDISSEMTLWMSDQPFDEPTRIFGNVTFHLYIECTNPLGYYPIEVSIYDGTEDEMTKVAEKVAKIIGFNYAQPSSLNVTIEDVDHTFEEGHYLGVGLRLVNRTIGSIELTLVRPSILFDSGSYPSYVQILTAPLDDIRVELEGSQAYQEIKRVGKAHYDIVVTNKGETGDTLLLSLKIINETFSAWPEGWYAVIELPTGIENAYYDWEREVYIGGNDLLSISIDIYPSPDAPDGSEERILFSAKGSYRGSDGIEGEIKVKVGKIRLSFVEVPSDGKVEIGKSHDYTFRIRNTGDDVDSFIVTARSDHGWVVGDKEIEINDLYPGNETEFTIRIRVPANLTSLPVYDTLLVEVASKTFPNVSRKISVYTKAIELSILEKIGQFFGGVSEEVDRRFGEGTSTILLVIAIILIVSLIAFSIHRLTRRFVDLICLDRIKELSPGEEAKIEVRVRNLLKKRLSCKVQVDRSILPEGWKIRLSKEELELDPKGEKKIDVYVRATEDILPESFAKIRLLVTPSEKPKTHSIDLLAISKGAVVNLEIDKVSHSPRIFRSGDEVVTKFILRNKGNVKAKNVRVSLRVNGEEMNTAQIDEIPPNGYAEVEMPWIALLGRNEISIVAEMGGS